MTPPAPTTTRLVVVDGSLAMHDFDIPGGSAPVKMARLHWDREREAMTVVVRFPPGWTRDGPGAYEAAEEFVVLNGALIMSGGEYPAGTWSRFPARHPRIGTHAGAGVLVLAHWSGAPRWIAGGPPPGQAPPAVPIGDDTGATLHLDARHVTSVSAAPEAGSGRPDDREVFDLAARVWAWVPADQPMPALTGPCLVRSYHHRTEESA